MKLGKRQTIIFILMGISISLFYYTNNLIQVAESFSDGIFIGFLLCLVLICSMTTVFLWGQMLYLNLRVRQCKKKK